MRSLRCQLFWSNTLFCFNLFLLVAVGFALENCNRTLNSDCNHKNYALRKRDLLDTTPSGLQPGNCRTGWHEFDNNCYLPVGQKREEWSDFEQARRNCLMQNGTLTSIEDAKEQIFLSFLMQLLKHSVWIGLYNYTESGVHTWLDNSSLVYTNWLRDKQSKFELQEPCIHMLYRHHSNVYHSHYRGHWVDTNCQKKLPYICKTKKDPYIKAPPILLSTQCIQQKEWLKQGFSCFKLFNERKNWDEAKAICEQHGAKLISISNQDIESTFKYLSMDMNSSSWIGLYVNSSQNFEWINGHPMTFSNWDRNQPAIGEKNNSCFTSSTDGFWNISPCEITRQFICQTNSDKPTPKKTKPKICMDNKLTSIAEENNFCYRIQEKMNRFEAYYKCHSLGGNLLSIHSRIQIEHLKKYLKEKHFHNVTFFIGLFRNEKGGFFWADGTPVDFEYWDKNETYDEMCVEMKPKTLKWKAVSCEGKKHTICNLETVSKHPHISKESGFSISGGALAGILVFILVILLVLVGVYLRFKPCKLKNFRKSQMSGFDNALYNVSLGSTI